MLDKAYDAKKYEDEIYRRWEEAGVFKADVNSTKESFTISMPPPNATGTLHLGHAVMLALEDIMARYHRMKGYEVLYLPGTDHAAIATENVVIKNLQAEGLKDPRSLGREKLVEKIAEFVTKSQHTIRSQIRKMGTSCDWSRERYTMDKALNRCVNEAFKRMYEDGLIYRAERVVNWDVALQTTLADDEVEYKEQEGMLYTIEYLTAEQTGGHPVYVSTSRPETKLGDNALAVNPDDERYKHLIGKDFDVVWPGGQTINVTIIADHEIDKEFGSGVLGVTPFHSKIDYDMWLRHKDNIKAQPIQVIDEQGRMTSAIKDYIGLTVNQAREKFVEELRVAGRLKEEKKYMQSMSISYRSKKPIEPLPKLQWFVNVNQKIEKWPVGAPEKWMGMTLREVMREVVSSREIEIIPSHFNNIYFHWIDNLKDWCISRQIWWGHRIPVWYCMTCDDIPVMPSDEQFDNDLNDKYEPATLSRLVKNPEIYDVKITGFADPIVSVYAPSACPRCKSNKLIQDEDTLDTWFSSAMWTWSTLVDSSLTDDLSLSMEEILKKSADYQKFHPTAVMETGYDIIFFWVARMILMTTYMTGQIPFKTVYLHGLIRTRDGKKMSKSDPKTCIDPLDMIEKYGTDALRMSMVIGNSPGNDMSLYEEKIKGYRNFVNKLWNASRFVLGLLEEKGITKEPEIDYEKLSDADRWILNELNSLISLITIKTKEGGFLAENEYRISLAGQFLYDFLWNDFCDWYLELSKGDKQNLGVLYYVLKNILLLLHPFTPFVTEEIWSHLPNQKSMLIQQSYPEPDQKNVFDDQHRVIGSIITIIETIRRLRSENKIEPAQKVPVVLHGKKNELESNKEDIIRLARVSELTWEESGEKPKDSVSDFVAGVNVYVLLGGLKDPEAEKKRVEKEVEQLQAYIASLSAKLSNKNFVQNAPEAVIKADQKRLLEAEERLRQLEGGTIN